MGTLERLERSIYEALRVKTVELGYTPDITQFNIDDPDINIAKVAQQQYNQKLKDIISNKGFAIEVFGYAPNQDRGIKKAPRIVLQSEAYLPGTVGLDIAPQYERVGDKYKIKKTTAITTNYYFTLHLISNTTKQHRVLHDIMVKSLPRIGYINLYQNDGQEEGDKVFIKYLSYYESDFLAEGIIEKVYRYEIPDIIDTEGEVEEGNIVPIKEIHTGIIGKDFIEEFKI